jgi:fructokinase
MTSDRFDYSSANPPQPLVVGEVLFDHFPNGERIIGGAPFNVAWNLRGLGVRPAFLSCVGNDAEGEEVKRSMQDWGLSTTALHTSNQKSTGTVKVKLIDGQPAYQIAEDQAFDFIDPPPFPVKSRSHSLIYSGSLALRHPHSRKTIMNLIKGSDLPCFVDVNVRQPWFDLDWASELISAANWIKLSELELALLADANWGQRSPSEADIIESVKTFCDLFYPGKESATCFITLGHRGACVITAKGHAIWVSPPPLEQAIEDTVGAGDAFVAGTIHGLLQDWSLNRTLAFAVGFAAKACTLKGATSSDRQHYLSAVT